MDSHNNRQELIDRVMPEQPTSLGGVRNAFIAVAAVIVAALVAMGWNSYQTKSWPSIDGKAESATIDHLRNTRTSRDSYILNLTYTYHLANSDYSGSGEQFYLSMNAAEAAKHSYVEDQVPLRVYYNPNEPSDSTLTPGKTADTIFWLLAGFLLIGGIAAYPFIFSKPKFNYASTAPAETDEEIVSRMHRGSVIFDEDELGNRLNKLNPDNPNP